MKRFRPYQLTTIPSAPTLRRTGMKNETYARAATTSAMPPIAGAWRALAKVQSAIGPRKRRAVFAKTRPLARDPKMNERIVAPRNRGLTRIAARIDGTMSARGAAAMPAISLLRETTVASADSKRSCKRAPAADAGQRR